MCKCFNHITELFISSPHVLISHGAVLLLPGRVEDVQQTRLPINHHLGHHNVHCFLVGGALNLNYLFPVRVLYGGIVFINEVVLYQLNCEGRLAHASRTNHNKLVLCHH